MTWDVPTAEDCPECGFTMFKKSGKGRMKPFCVNETCSKFLPEDQRGYYKKKTATEGTEGEPEGEPGISQAAEKAEKKTGARKTAAGKTAEKKPVAKKTSAKKTAAKKPAAKKTADKKPAAKKNAATKAKKTAEAN
jgi:DNA topoisomerase-1